jgi:hypothetical protein
VPVVLFSFNDLDFSMDNPAAYYDRLFNEKGFNEGMGPGCVADYFRDQSAGRLNLVFDIYGPVKIYKGVLSHYYYDNGWCPPNLSAMERMYLGWAMPEELTEPASIEGICIQGGKLIITTACYRHGRWSLGLRAGN